MCGFWCDPFEENNSANPEKRLPQTLGFHASAYDDEAFVKKNLFDFARPGGVWKK